MRVLLIAAFAPIALANSFPASKYELVARFTGALVRNDLSTARRMLVSNPKIYDWTSGDKTLAQLANYMRSCPIKGIEGNDDNNINVNLNCGGEDQGMSLEFTGHKIRKIGFGPPPKPNINVRPDQN